MNHPGFPETWAAHRAWAREEERMRISDEEARAITELRGATSITERLLAADLLDARKALDAARVEVETYRAIAQSHPALAVVCPTCKRIEWFQCIDDHGWAISPHPERIAAAAIVKP